MSEDKQADNDPERTLVTLEQLSQTIEVMTSVVNRLRQHLSQQLEAKAKLQEPEPATETAAEDSQAVDVKPSPAEQQESFVVEIRQYEPNATNKSDKTLH